VLPPHGFPVLKAELRHGPNSAFGAVMKLPECLGNIPSAEMVEATVLYRVFVNLFSIIAALAFTGVAVAPEHVPFATADGGTRLCRPMRKGDRGVVLAHGGRFHKESGSLRAAFAPRPAAWL